MPIIPKAIPYSEYADPTANGSNQFLGQGSGNNTLSPGGGAADLASGNLGCGPSTVTSLTTGEKNIAIGVGALNADTTGNENVAIGCASLSLNVAGHESTAVGNESLAFATGGQNTALGGASGNGVTTGTNNVFIGVGAGVSGTVGNQVTTGSNNTHVGHLSGPSTSTQLTNTIAIGKDAVVGASNATVIGNSSTTAVSIFGTPQGTVVASTPTIPTSTSLTGEMAGLALSFTPKLSGRLLLIVNLLISNSVAGSGGFFVMKFGTGSAPAHSAAPTGTSTANLSASTKATANAIAQVPSIALVGGLTPGTAYWFDLEIAAVTSGTATFASAWVQLVEL
jgi:hypothetical protein